MAQNYVIVLCQYIGKCKVQVLLTYFGKCHSVSFSGML